MTTINEIFGPHGILSKNIEGFNPRECQLEMAQEIALALANNKQLIIEAGTGVGKTFAYLIPALLSKKKVIISTGTKHLQDQIFNRDIPLLRKILKLPIKVALLKGRANYLCHHRLDKYFQDGYFLSQQVIHDIQIAKQWSTQTKVGDITELSAIREDSLSLKYITSNTDNCLGQDCSFINQCFLVKARKIAQEADLLIINHHLFFADMAIKDTGFGEILPGAEAIIFDEAHQLLETASHFFSESLSSWQIIELAKDITTTQMKDANDCVELRETADEIINLVNPMRLALGAQDSKSNWRNIIFKPALQVVLQELNSQFIKLNEQLSLLSERSKDLKKCSERCQALLTNFQQMALHCSDDKIHWYENIGKHFRIHLTPHTFSEKFQNLLSSNQAWIFTSATLSINEDFNYFKSALGIKADKLLNFVSPFNYKTNTLMFIPSNLPSPESENYIEQLVETAIPVLHASKGRAFFLFTSHRALLLAARILEHENFSLFIQGKMPKTILLEKFRETSNAILLGTYSFWEGVDVRGQALSCVIIDKLPFSTPDDPILKARIYNLRANGRDPFYEYQLPNAVILLKQGVGRLIRDQADCGVIMIGDTRLINKPYGNIFMQSLPDIPVTHNFNDVDEFFKKIT